MQKACGGAKKKAGLGSGSIRSSLKKGGHRTVEITSAREKRHSRYRRDGTALSQKLPRIATHRYHQTASRASQTGTGLWPPRKGLRFRRFVGDHRFLLYSVLLTANQDQLSGLSVLG